MKHFLSVLLFAFCLLGCSSSTNKTNPLIEKFLLDHIANPETYKPIKTEVIDQGTIDVQRTVNWFNVPAEGNLDVVVLRHEFSNVDITDALSENAFIFYMSPAQDVLYYAHKDKGIVLFPLDK